MTQTQNGNDFSVTQTPLGNTGLILENRLRVASVLAIEEEFDTDFPAINFNRLKNMMIILYYLAKQVNDSMSRDEFMDIINNVDVVTLKQHLSPVLDINLKNSPGPNQTAKG